MAASASTSASRSCERPLTHGTAFDIAGKGIANETGMREAVLAAAYIATTGRLPE